MITYFKKGMQICFVLILRVVLTLCITSQSRFVVKENERIAAIPYGDVFTESRLECAMKCQSSWNCTAANYLVETKTCYFFTKTCFLTEVAFGWYYLSQTARQRTFHLISNQATNWTNAKNYCKSIGGDLASINSPTDHDMILNIISQAQQIRAWIGGSDIDNEGDWIWTNGWKFNDQEFSFWRSGNPDNYNDNEHCLQIYNLEWNDQNCGRHESFVCEIYVA